MCWVLYFLVVIYFVFVFFVVGGLNVVVEGECFVIGSCFDGVIIVVVIGLYYLFLIEEVDFVCWVVD